MFPRESSFVTTWLAMYCGDPEFLANQVKDTSAEELSHDRNGWPRIDSKSEIKRLFSSARSVPIDGSTTHDKKAQSLVCVKSNLVRAIVEPISALQFCLRGYLVDLSQESVFAKRVLQYQQDFGVPSDTNEGSANRPDGLGFETDLAPTYAGMAIPRSNYFVGEIIFSDFAWFELNGFVINQNQENWKTGFLADLQGIVDAITP